MELKQYLMLLRHWAWLLILGLVLGAGAGYGVAYYQTPVYQASTKILIMRAPEDATLVLSTLTDQQYSQTFTELLVTRPVIDATTERLGYRVSAGQIDVQRVRDAQIIEVTVTDSNPQRAAEIANTLVSVFLEQNDELQASRFASSEQSLDAQLQQVEKQISDLRNQLTELNVASFDTRIQDVTRTIADLQAEILALQREIVVLEYPKAPLETADERGRLILMTPTASLAERTELTLKRDRLSELQALLRMYQEIYVRFTFADQSGADVSRSADQIQAALALYEQIYANLLSNYESIRLARLKSTPNVVQVEEAVAPRRPISPRPTTNMIIGGIAGLVLAGVIAYLIEYLDDTLRTEEEVSEILQLPVLGYIGEMARSARRAAKNGKAVQPYVVSQPRSPVAEAFRSLRTNLEFAELDKPLKTILLTSPGISEGKTTIAVNLAYVIAQAGKQVILLDADLRRPRLHHYMGIPNRTGLSDVLRDYSNLQTVAQPTDNECLSVITSGTLPPNPVEVLNSEKMARVITDLKEQADVVIIDGPPFLLADASVLSVKSDGVLIVVQLNRTQASATLAMLDQLKRVGARIIGAAINRIDRRETSFYYKHLKDYHYFSYDNSNNHEKKEEKKLVEESKTK
jgi:capsular exopolysaccharide synthesis family protein